MHLKKYLSFLCWMNILIDSIQKELCNLSNMETLYLQLGEKGRIIFDSSISTSMSHCGIELVTCPFCLIKITVDYHNFLDVCNIAKNPPKDECSCGKLTLWEFNYDEPRYICYSANTTSYRSSSRSISIMYDKDSLNVIGSIAINYISQKNQNFIKGVMGTNGFITSPKFPSLYSRDFGTEYILLCSSKDCIVNILFTDFLISTSSIMEFFDSDGKLINLVSGSKPRPPYISSTGPSMTVRFFGNGGSSLGYKANYIFQNKSLKYQLNTECGGEIQNLGGSIYMDGIDGNFDCFWIIKPAPSLAYLKTHIYIKVLNFSGTGEVEIRKGITSESSIVEVLPNNNNNQEHVATITKGFYISFKGVRSYSSKLIISYAAFSYMGCLSGVDYLCSNNRCILLTLVCDSFDNCGDNTDEIWKCQDSTEEIEHKFWWQFRNSDINEAEGKISLGLWMCGMVFASAFLLLFSTICHRTLRIRPINSNQLDHRTANEQIGTITQLLTVEELNEQDEPPVYEPPPDYSQAVKPSHRRKHSNAKLIGKSSTPHHFEEPSTSSATLKPEEDSKEIIASSINMTSTSYDSVTRNTPDSSMPVSLETTGYDEQELGVSLTLSAETNRENEQRRSFQWMSKPLRKTLTDSVNSSRLSAISFDTLHSSQERVIDSISYVVKCHSHDNIPSVYSNLNKNITFTYNHLR